MGKKYFDLGSFKKDCGKTSSELAKLLNISHSNMSRYDNESGAMPIKYVLELCNIFNAELSDYLKDILETDEIIASFECKETPNIQHFFRLRELIFKRLFAKMHSIKEAAINNSTKAYLIHEYYSFLTFLADYFHVPTIVVTGDSSSGKSTFCSKLLNLPNQSKTTIPTFYIYKSEFIKSELNRHSISEDFIFIKNINFNLNYFDFDFPENCKEEEAVFKVVFEEIPALQYFNLVDLPGIDSYENIPDNFIQALYTNDILISFSSPRNMYTDFVSLTPYMKNGGRDTLFLASRKYQLKEYKLFFKENISDEMTNMDFLFFDLTETTNLKYSICYEKLQTALQVYYDTCNNNCKKYFSLIEYSYAQNFPNSENYEKISKKEMEKKLEFWKDSYPDFFLESNEIISDAFYSHINKKNIDKLVAELSSNDSDVEHFPYNLKQLNEITEWISLNFCNEVIKKIEIARNSFSKNMLFEIENLSKTNSNPIFQVIFKTIKETLNNISEKEPRGLIPQDMEDLWLFQALQNKNFRYSEYYLKCKISSDVTALLRSNTKSVTTYARGLTNSKTRKISNALNEINSKDVRKIFKDFIMLTNNRITDELENINATELKDLQIDKCKEYLSTIDKIFEILTQNS